MLSEEEFVRYRDAGYSQVPVWRGITATGLTPLAAYRRLGRQGDDYLFETRTAQAGAFVDAYSYIGLPGDKRIEITGRRVRKKHQDRILEEYETPEPLSVLKKC